MLRELPKPLVNVPSISGAQMLEVERLMQEEYRLNPEQSMELGGRHLAHLARLLFLKGKADGKAVALLVSPSSKGGVVLAAARRLHQWGANVRLVLSHSVDDFQGMVATQLDRVQRQGLIIVEPPSLGGSLIIDGLEGLNWQSEPTDRIVELIEWANRQLSPVLALEAPAGLDVETGQQRRVCMRASATLALALPKGNVMKDSSRAVVGEVYLADVSVPQALYAAPGLDLKVGPIFSESDIVRLR